MEHTPLKQAAAARVACWEMQAKAASAKAKGEKIAKRAKGAGNTKEGRRLRKLAQAYLEQAAALEIQAERLQS